MSTRPEDEAVDHPQHYGGADAPHETIKCLEAWGLEKDALLWNAAKYISRAGAKPSAPMVQDLEKAAFYLQRRIEALKAVGTPAPAQSKPQEKGTAVVFSALAEESRNAVAAALDALNTAGIGAWVTPGPKGQRPISAVVVAEVDLAAALLVLNQRQAPPDQSKLRACLEGPPLELVFESKNHRAIQAAQAVLSCDGLAVWTIEPHPDGRGSIRVRHQRADEAREALREAGYGAGVVG